MVRSAVALTGLVLAGGFAATPLHAETIESTVVYDGSERTLQSDGSHVSGPFFNTAGFTYVGGNIPTTGQYEDWNTLLPFDLSSVTPGTVAGATLNIFIDFMRANPLPFDVDLYGVGTSADTGTLPDTAANLFYVGAADSNYDLLVESFMTGAVDWPPDKYVDGTSAALVNYLNASRPAGEDIVWLRLNHDLYTMRTGDERVTIGDSATKGYPYLELTIAVPSGGTVVMVR
jgi:hypothetical protein